MTISGLCLVRGRSLTQNTDKSFIKFDFDNFLIFSSSWTSITCCLNTEVLIRSQYMPTFIDCMLLKNVNFSCFRWPLCVQTRLYSLLSPTIHSRSVLFVSSTETRLWGFCYSASTSFLTLFRRFVFTSLPLPQAVLSTCTALSSRRFSPSFNGRRTIARLEWVGKRFLNN